METLTITNEQFQQALCWINGQASTLGEKEVLDMLRALTDGFRENCRRLRPGPVPRFRCSAHSPVSLGALMEEALVGDPSGGTDAVQEVLPKSIVGIPVEERPGADEALQPVRLDSAQLINSIAHVGASAGFPVTQSRAQMILYCLYGSRLGAGKDRLDIEHPQVWKYGPVFPRAYKRSSIGDSGICADAYGSLRDANPEIVSALAAKTHSMMATPMADLNAVHKGVGSPYAHVLSMFPQKWGTPIPDEDIATFFRKNRR